MQACLQFAEPQLIQAEGKDSAKKDGSGVLWTFAELQPIQAEGKDSAKKNGSGVLWTLADPQPVDLLCKPKNKSMETRPA